jgi:hypothetical protein
VFQLWIWCRSDRAVFIPSSSDQDHIYYAVPTVHLLDIVLNGFSLQHFLGNVVESLWYAVVEDARNCTLDGLRTKHRDTYCPYFFKLVELQAGGYVVFT